MRVPPAKVRNLTRITAWPISLETPRKKQIGVDLFGLKQKGTRLTLALEDKPGAMFGVLKVIRDHKLNVISIVSPSFFVEGNRVAAIRIATEKYEAIVKDLEKAGYPVLSVGKWPSL